MAILVLTACGQDAGRAASEQSPSAAASAQPSLSPSPSTDAFYLTCRLPVVDNSDGGTNRGWVTFPGGQFARDASKQSNGSYDWAIHAWVPVGEQWVAPDGASYVMQTQSPKVPSAIYLVNARTGSRKLILSTQGPSSKQTWSIVTYTGKGVFLGAYLSYGVEVPSLVPGLWLLDPQSGRVRLVDGHNWDMIGGGFAWRVDDTALGGTLYKVYRLDLATGQTIALYESKTSIGLFSPTAEGELLVVYGDEDRLALLDASRVLTPIDWPPEFDIGYDSGEVYQPGIWITDTNGLGLYMKGLGIRVMATNPEPKIQDSLYLYVAGDCR